MRRTRCLLLLTGCGARAGAAAAHAATPSSLTGETLTSHSPPDNGSLTDRAPAVSSPRADCCDTRRCAGSAGSGPGNDRIYGARGNDTIYGGSGNDLIYVRKPGHTTVFPGSGTNWVDVADGRGDDRVVCASGSVNYIHADRGDHISRSCRGKGSIS